MKKYLFFAGIAAMMLASCTSEGVVNPVAPEETPTTGVPMLFSTHKGNQSRATNMEAENYAFGVSAYKTSDTYLADLADVSEITVMDRYLVAYWDGNVTDWEGYKPAQGQATPTSWYYDLLGSADNGYTFNTEKNFFEVDNTLNINQHQYLKYWDLSKNSTFFFGYAPFGKATVTPADGKATIDFGTITAGPGESYMYGAVKCTNSEYIFDNATSTGAPKYVDINFTHFLGQVRLAFYNAIPGYDVDLIDYSTAPDDGGVIAVPAVAGTPYTLGSYQNTCKFSVDYTYDTTYGLVATPHHTALTATTTQDNLVCPIDYFYDATGALSTRLGESYATKLVSARYNVVPQTATCGFTVNVSFKLTAKDTGEVLYIRGARVFVASDYCNWTANGLYTYVFRLTTKSSGSTGADTAPTVSPEPTTNQALWPIVFDKVTVTDMSTDEVTGEWDINPGIPGNHEPSAH